MSSNQNPHQLIYLEFHQKCIWDPSGEGWSKDLTAGRSETAAAGWIAAVGRIVEGYWIGGRWMDFPSMDVPEPVCWVE
jgi:hypothetical protein